jgi:hypothetical protein
MAVLILVVLAMLAFPAVAAAGEASRVDGELRYAGDAQPDRFQIVLMTGEYGFDSDFDGAAITAGDGCVLDVAGPRCGTGATRLSADLGAGNDRARFAPELDAPPWPIPTEMSGGPGADELVGGVLDDVLLGGEGDDLLRPRAGGGRVEGGEGDDSIPAVAGPVHVLGGPGRDDVQFFGPDHLTVSLDGAPNDPHGSNLDVEDVTTDAGDDTVLGSIDANTIITFGGNDRIDPGTGPDTVLAGGDDDRIEAEDGWLDPDIDCGAGQDTVIVDFVDVVAGNCEVVLREGPDADDDDVSPPADCDDNNRFIRPGADDIPRNGVDEDCSGADADADRDGFLAPIDCNDANAAIRPGARDIRGNHTDEDCSGADARLLRNRAAITARWRALRRHTRVRALTVRRVPARGTVRLACRGRGCPVRQRRLRVRRGRATATALLRRARLRPGAVIELRITAPETRRKTVRYTIRASRAPRRRATR